jgi:hypothetical protein
MSQEQEQDSSPLVPIEQQTILFYGKPLVVVRLPDRRLAIVLRHICDNLQLEPTSQVRRIKRTEAIVDDLVYTQIQTDGGPQIMSTLVLRAAPFWLAGIDPKRVREEIRPEILRYQREVVDVLYSWAQSPKVTDPPATLVPAEQITEHVQVHLTSEFPCPVSYQRFVALIPGTLVPLLAYLQSRFAACTGISFIDSTSLQVCDPKRISGHRVFATDAR